MKPELGTRWILANALGFSLGGALGGQVGRVLEEPHVGITSPGRGALVLAMGAGTALGVFGAAVGLAQWLALRRRVPRVAWWAPATTGGWAAGGDRCRRPVWGDRWGDHECWGRLRHVGLGGRRDRGRRGHRPPAGGAPVAAGSRRAFVDRVTRSGAGSGLGGRGARDPARGKRPGPRPSLGRGLGDRRPADGAPERCDHGGAPGSFGRGATR